MAEFSSINTKSALILGILIGAGLLGLGITLGHSAIAFKEYERVVSVKGLSERDVPADVAIWPIKFSIANNDLTELYNKLETDNKKIREFLVASEFAEDEISASVPIVVDKLAQDYDAGNKAEFRYTVSQIISIRSNKIDKVRLAETKISELGKKGIVFSGREYDAATEYSFTKLNDIKPAMIEEATRKAREVAEKFAKDSSSKLGKIKNANQGTFTIEDRDKNTPYMKSVRVVSTVDYYLSD